MGCGQAPLRVGWWSILQICRAGLLKKGAKNGTFCELYTKSWLLFTSTSMMSLMSRPADTQPEGRVADVASNNQSFFNNLNFEFKWCFTSSLFLLGGKTKQKVWQHVESYLHTKWSEVYFQNYSLPWSWTDDGSKSHAFANAGNAKVSVLVSSHFFENRKRKQIKA